MPYKSVMKTERARARGSEGESERARERGGGEGGRERVHKEFGNQWGWGVIEHEELGE
jgi:hypothetical protein